MITYLSLALEVQNLVDRLHDRLAEVDDPQGVLEAGQAFRAAGQKLVEISKRMEAHGVPDAATRQEIERRSAVSTAQNAAKLSDSLGEIIRLEGVGGEFTTEIVNFRKQAEELPILNAYGITVSPSRDDKPQDE